MISVKVISKTSKVEVLERKRLNIDVTGNVILQDSSGYEDYNGSYEATSAFETLEFHTAKKKLERNITIKPLPVSEVSNSAGGTTLSIG